MLPSVLLLRQARELSEKVCIIYEEFCHLVIVHTACMYPLPLQPEGQTCVRAQYGARSETTITVYNTGNQPDGEFIEICGYAYQRDPVDRPARLAVV